MRYDNGQDWVEIKGVAAKPMRELLIMDAGSDAEAHGFCVGVTVDAHFTDQHGAVVDWKADMYGLTVQQWNWWKSRIWAAARDERIDPEA